MRTVRPIEAYEVPRPSGGSRRMARLHPDDARAWSGIARACVVSIEASLGGEVLSTRADPATSRLRPWRPAWRGLVRDAERIAAGAEAVLSTDVRAFYPSVTSDALWSALRRIGIGSGVARRAASFIETWSSAGYPGLPIGPDPSAVLANALLLPADRALRRARVPFVRWVDDYTIGVDGRRAGEILERLDLALEVAGLHRAVGKTNLLLGGRPPSSGLAASGVPG